MKTQREIKKTFRERMPPQIIVIVIVKVSINVNRKDLADTQNNTVSKTYHTFASSLKNFFLKTVKSIRESLSIRGLQFKMA